MIRTFTLSALLGLTAACSLPWAVGTSLLVDVQVSSSIAVDQLQFTVTSSTATISNSAPLPTKPGANLEGLQSVRVLLPDSLAGQMLTVVVTGLSAGSAVITTSGTAVVRRGQQVQVQLSLPGGGASSSSSTGTTASGTAGSSGTTGSGSTSAVTSTSGVTSATSAVSSTSTSSLSTSGATSTSNTGSTSGTGGSTGSTGIPFGSPTQIALGPDVLNDLVAADFTGTGRNDVIVVTAGSQAVLLTNDGQGTLTSSGSFSTGQGPVAVAAADVDNQRQLDLVTANTDGTVTVMLNSAEVFGSPIVSGSGLSPVGLVLADFNNDNNIDVAVANDTHTGVSVLLGNGDGTFGAPVSYGGTPVTAIATEDLNADGFNDLVVTYCFGSVCSASVLLNLGDGGAFPTGPLNALTEYPVDATPTAIAIADVNGDRIADILITSDKVTSTGENSLTVLLGQGDGTFAPAAGSPFATAPHPQALAIGNLNGDRFVDLVAANGAAHELSLMWNNADGTGSFSAPLTVASIPNSDFTALVLTDLTGSSNDLVAIDRANAAVDVVLGN